MTERRCGAVKRDGTPCRGQALPSGEFCWAHAPELAEKRKAAWSRGGSQTSRGARAARMLPSEMRPVFELLSKALTETHRGTLDPKRAAALASLAGAMCRVLQVGEMETRLAQLEQAINEQENIDNAVNAY